MRFLPINISTELIFKLNTYHFYKYPDYIDVKNILEIDLDNINADKSIIEYCKFRKSRGYDGVILINRENNEFMAYAFYTDKITPPTNIPKLPKGAGWLFNDFVSESYRGKGLQKVLINYRIIELRKNNPDIEIYTDILEDNIPSIKSYLNSGFKPYGKYYLFSIGIRRYKFLSIKFGYWDKKFKHKQITK